LIVLTTAQGDLNIRGEELHIERIDLELGQLEVRGHIQDLSYDEPKTTRTLWSRLFG
jgi:sporulation protein YabP